MPSRTLRLCTWLLKRFIGLKIIIFKRFKIFQVQCGGVRCQFFATMVGENIHFLNVMYMFSTRDPQNHISTKPIYLYLLHQYVRPFPQSHTEYGHADQDIKPGKQQIGFTVAGSLQTPGGERSNLEVTIQTETSRERSAQCIPRAHTSG